MNKPSSKACASPTPERPGFGHASKRVEVLNPECRHPAGDYRYLFELNPNPMWIFDEATLRFLAVNEAAVKLYGWSAAEFRRLTVKHIRPPQEVPRLEQILPGQRDSRAAFVGQWRHWTKDHRAFDVEVTVSCFPFQGRNARLVMVHDITERKQAEQALRESEQRYRAIFRQASDAVLVFDPETLRPIEFNDEACRHLGYTRDEFARLAVSELELVESAAETRRHCARVIRKGLEVFETRHRTQSGEVRDVEVRATPIRVGNRTLIQAFWRDITERKRAEQYLRESAVELERRVQQRTADLRHANALLVLEMKRRRELESQVLDIGECERCQIGQDLHDNVCSQLSGIEYLCQALAQELAGAPGGARRQVTKIIRLLQEAMSDARKLAQGLCPLSLEDQGLLLGLEDLAARSRSIYGCRCAFRGDPAAVIADPARALHLYRIAQEAVANAVKHSQARRIRITLTARGRAVVLRVWDNGVGIVSHPRSHQGLGLVTMEIRAHALGGALAVQRNRHGGTSVVCTVPNGLQPSPTRRRP